MGTPYKLMTAEQKAKAHAANKRWGLKNKEKRAAYRHKHYMENRDKYLHIERERVYKSRYGVGVADYDRMLKEQGGVCKICKRDKPSRNEKFRFYSIDHCHKTGKVRGLLCAKCNGALGWFEMHGKSAMEYLGVLQ